MLLQLEIHLPSRKVKKKEIDFQFLLPVHTPPTIGKTKVWIQTGLDVPNAVDPKDRDYINVEPHRYMNTVFRCPYQ